MDWNGLATRLRASCSREIARGDGWVCYAPTGDAVDVRELMVECATAEDFDDWTPMHGDLRESDASPSGTAGALHDEWSAIEVVVWEWVGRASSWSGSLSTFEASDGRHYVARFLDGEPYLVVGAITPAPTRASFVALFRQLMKDNGEEYGIDMLGSLPASTELHRPDLLPREVLTEIYREWVESAEAAGTPAWTDLEEQLEDMELDEEDEFDDDDAESESEESEGEEHERLIEDYVASTVLIVDRDEDDA